MQFAISFPKRFTFHYVSIKTQKTELLTSYQLNLHSTMYLLKLFQRNHINHWLLYLHSTMYLLKQSDFMTYPFAIKIYIPLCIY